MKDGDTGSSFGKRLHLLRKNAGFSQKELSRKLGYKTPATIANAEKDAGPLDQNVLSQIAKTLDADLHWLITGKPCPRERELEETRRETLMRLAKYIARSLAQLLNERESLLADLAAEKKRQTDGEGSEEGYIELLQSQLYQTEQMLSEHANDQPWVLKALKEVEKNINLLKKPHEQYPSVDGAATAESVLDDAEAAVAKKRKKTQGKVHPHRPAAG